MNVSDLKIKLILVKLKKTLKEVLEWRAFGYCTSMQKIYLPDNIESININGYCMVKFNDKYYKNAIEFFNKAVIDDKKFYEWINNVDYVEVV